jgi:hypothetical protein
MKRLVIGGLAVLAVLTVAGCSSEGTTEPAPAFGSKAGPPGQAAGAGAAPSGPQVNANAAGAD